MVVVVMVVVPVVVVVSEPFPGRSFDHGEAEKYITICHPRTS